MHTPFFFRGEMVEAEEENYSWLFVRAVPLLYEKKNVLRQRKVEEWLDLYQLTEELKIQKLEKQEPLKGPINYVV